MKFYVSVLICLISAAVLIFTFRTPAVDRSRVWKVGTDNTLPYHALDALTSQPIGLAAGLLDIAAKRQGIRLEWQRTPVASLAQKKVDLWPANSYYAASPQVHVTKPFLRQNFVIVYKRPDWHVGKPKVSLRSHSRNAYFQAQLPEYELLIRSERAEALSSLCRDEADGFLVEDRPLQALLLNRPMVCEDMQLYVTGAKLPPQELGFGSTPEAAPVADLLRAELDSMIEHGEFSRLTRSWSYYSTGDIELIHREAKANRAQQIALGLVLLLIVLAAGLLVLFIHSSRAKREAIEANQAKNEFLANISHEIRTPLNGILGLAEVLSAAIGDEKQRGLLMSIHRSGKNLLALVNDVLDLSKVSHGQFDLKPEIVKLRKLFDEVAPAFATAADAKGLKFEMSGVEHLPSEVMVDPLRLRQIFMNLVGNAIKFTDQGEVSVQFFSNPMDVHTAAFQLEVKDTGIGIAQDARKRLFEKFYQADSSISRRFGGSGLGLSIVKEITTAMGGSIELDSVQGIGSTFRVSLPLPIVQGLPQAIETPSISHTDSVKMRVLVVEDNAVNQFIVKSFLETAGHDVVLAMDGIQAVDEWKKGGFHLILMDCQMPVMDGYEATAEIRKLEESIAKIPIIALTASAMTSEMEKCLQSGMDDFISKPVDSATLLNIVERWGMRTPVRI